MLIFLYGPDDYRRSQKKRDLISEFTKKRTSLGLRSFDFESKEEIAQFEEFGANQFIFGSAKLAVIENAFEVEAKELAKLLKPFAARKDTTVLLSEHEKPVKVLSFLTEEPAFSQKFENLEGPAWMSFIAAEAKKAGLALDASAVQFLATVYQGNSWALVTELQKLASWSSSSSPHVIIKTELDQFDLEAAPNYWALITALKSADPRSRLLALEKMLSLNDPPAKIFNILASQWQEKIPQIAEFDFAVKSGKMEYEEAILELVVG
jgi:DNA polymerase III delta subunit